MNNSISGLAQYPYGASNSFSKTSGSLHDGSTTVNAGELDSQQPSTSAADVGYEAASFKTSKDTLPLAISEVNHAVRYVPYEKRYNEDKLDSGDENEDDNYEHKSNADIFLTAKVDEFGFIHPADTFVRGTHLDLKKLRSREKKWLEMLSNWTYYMTEKYEKVRERCRKGIPPSLRGRAWKNLCGAAFHMDFGVNKNVFDEVSAKVGDPKFMDEIRKDLSRQFPQHVMFSHTGPYGKGGKSDLFELLKAYTVLHPEEGYCQAQAPIAAVLLMHMPLRDAFYCFVQICHKYLPGYFSVGLKKFHIEPVLYMVEWFMCIYCRALPWPTVLRVWDMFFCEGVKVLFKVAVVLIHYSLGSKEQRKECSDFHSIVTRLKNLPEHVTSEKFLIEKVINLDLDDEEMEKVHYRIMKTRQMRSKN